MSNSIKVAIITHTGGAHLGAYFAALADSPEAESVVLVDPDNASVPRAKERLGSKLTKVYDNADDMLRIEKPSMALVSMEAAKAPPAIDAALEAGVHVFAEKPACVRAEEFEALARKADSKHLSLMLALANRSRPAVKKARTLIDSGAIGKIYSTELQFIADQTRLTRPEYHRRWYAKKARAGGGHLIWLGIHGLDLAMHVMGTRCQQVAGFAGVVGGQPLDIEDSAAMAIRFDNDTFASVNSGYYLDRGKQSMIKIWGSKGWLQLGLIRGEEPLVWYENGSDGPQSYEEPEGVGGYTPFVRAAVRSVAGLEEPPISSQESLHVLQTIHAFYRSAETGQVQNVG